MMAPALNTVRQQAFRLVPNQIADPGTLAEALRRGIITEEQFESNLARLGLDKENLEALRDGTDPLIPPELLFRLHRMGRISDETLDEMLASSPMSEAQQAVLKRTTEFFPTPQDLITWLGREVFEEETVAQVGLDEDLDKIEMSLFDRAGVSPEMVRNFWRAHWQHPSLNQFSAMMHRGFVSEDDFDTWAKLVELPPFWRENMKQITFSPYTRVDVRRMWDMGVLDDPQTIRAYMDLGYNNEKAVELLKFTKAERLLPDLRRMYGNAWISEEELRSRVAEIGLAEEPTQRLIQTIIKNDAPGRIAPERDLTKAETVKGVKLGVIDVETGVKLLSDLGYSRPEAIFILAVGKAVTLDESLTPIPYVAITETRPLGD